MWDSINKYQALTTLLSVLVFNCFVSVIAYANSPYPSLLPINQTLNEVRNYSDDIISRKYEYEEKREGQDFYEYGSDGTVRDMRYEGMHEHQKSERPLTRLEKSYSLRAGEKLKQFGYDLFGIPDEKTQRHLNSIAKATTPPMGAVQSDFVLGQGDEIQITFIGQRNDSMMVDVNSQGLVLIKDFPPIPAEGRTIGQLRLSIEAAAKNMHNTQAFVSLASVRQISVLVAGEVRHPGLYTHTVFHTVLDALISSGGVKKDGSLRRIRLFRDGKSQQVDLYGLLLGNGGGGDFRLRDGDKIIVPSLGPTVAVAGEVKRSGIYELLSSHTDIQGTSYDQLTLYEMLDLAGGVLAPGKNRFLKLDIRGDGKESVHHIHNMTQPNFSGGSVLFVSKGRDTKAEGITLKGHTPRPGLYGIAEYPRLSVLLSGDDMVKPDIYPLLGMIKRWDSKNLSYQWLDFPLREVLSGHYDLDLQQNDTVFLFSEDDILSLKEEDSERSINSETMSDQKYPTDDALKTTFTKNEDNEEIPLIVRSFLAERIAFVRGSVRKPGFYPLPNNGVSLASLIAATGGIAYEGSTGNIEITSLLNGKSQEFFRSSIDLQNSNAKKIMIHPGDTVRINQKFERVNDKTVLIMGEVVTPGRYDLMPGDMLSSLLERAGGYTTNAYPEGAIFSRESEREAEEARFHSQAQQMKQAAAAALEMEKGKISPSEIAEVRGLAAELEDAEGIGRITVQADQKILQKYPEQDVILEAGDRIYIPKRAPTVRVFGEVLSPATLQFGNGKEPLDYIKEAGGFTFHADKRRTFVLFPNGSAKPLGVTSWNQRSDDIPPGSTIIVPRDPKPFDFLESAKDVSQILSNLAITGIFLQEVQYDD